MGEASIGRTSCASDRAWPAAAKGDADRARKDNNSWAVTRPAEVHLAPASFLFASMLGAVRMGPCQTVGREGK
jgi:hypothetical protein